MFLFCDIALVGGVNLLLSFDLTDVFTEAGMLAAQGGYKGFVPQLSLLVAYLFMAMSVMVLVYFLNHVPSNDVTRRMGPRHPWCALHGARRAGFKSIMQSAFERKYHNTEGRHSI